jgi:hypothetical protein
VPAWDGGFYEPPAGKIIGWHQVSVGLVSSSAQRRRGRWVHRTDWAWIADVEAARRHMSGESMPGVLPAVALLWMPVRVVHAADPVVVSVGAARHLAFQGLHWRLLRAFMVASLPQEPRLDYLFVKQYVRSPAKQNAQRESWQHSVLETSRAVGGLR